MDLLDIYLLRSSKSKRDVVSKTGIDQSLLDTRASDTAVDLPREAIIAIAETVRKTKETVRIELERLEEKDRYTEVYNSDDLLAALNKKEPHIIIKGDMINTFNETYQLPLTETEQIGFNLGFRGFAGIIDEIYYRVLDLFRSEKDEKKQIERKMRRYTIKYFNADELLLYLRQLEY